MRNKPESGVRQSKAGSQGADFPTTEDLLDFTPLVAQISRRILESDRESTPLTVGIYGRWGSGKTSFLMMVADELRRGGIHPVWFNSWKYDREENLWAALIQTVLDQSRISGGWTRRILVRWRIWWRGLSLRKGSWDVSRKLGTVLLRLGLFALGVYFLFHLPAPVIHAVSSLRTFSGVTAPESGKGLGTVASIVTGICLILLSKPELILKLFDARLGIDLDKFSKKKSHLERIAFLDEFTKDLEELVELVSINRVLVVIIDDLDRCNSDKALQVLEAIKLFLDVKGCIFLLAVDQEVVERAISVKFDDFKQTEVPGDLSVTNSLRDLSHAYFEKLIQLPLSLPPLSNESLTRLVEHACTDEDLKSCAELFTLGLPANPRTLKRHVQIISFLRAVAKDALEAGELHLSLLAKIVILQNTYGDVYRDVLDDPHVMKDLESLARTKKLTEQSEGGDAAYRSRVQTYSAKYPKLMSMLSRSINDRDTFIAGDIDQYIYLTQSVAGVKEGSEKASGKVLGTHARETEDFRVQVEQSMSWLSSRFSVDTDLYERDFVEPSFVRLGHNSETAREGESGRLTLHDVLQLSSRLILIGRAGSGKTRTTMHLGLLLSKSGGDGEGQTLEALGLRRQYIPIFLRARDFTALDVSSLSEAIMRASISGESTSASEQQTQLEAYLFSGKCFVIIDGIDEADRINRKQILRLLQQTCRQYPGNYYLVTSRPGLDVQEELYGWEAVELSWPENTLMEVLGKSLPPESRARVFEHFARTHQSIDTPLMARMFAEVFLKRGDVEDDEALLGIFIDTLLSKLGGKLDEEDGISRQMLVAVYRALARRDNRGVNRSIQVEEIIETIQQTLGCDRAKAANLLPSITEGTGILVQERPGAYRFVHETFMEYLSKP